MALYLKLDGVDDRINVPSITYNEIVIDMGTARERVTGTGSMHYFDLRPGINTLFYSTGATGVDYYSGSATLYVDGVQKNNNTNSIPHNARSTIRFVPSAAGTGAVVLFARNDGLQTFPADVYSVKFYNSGTLVAHYDMTTGTVQDQSGNGKHATLVGGEWVDDGTGGGDPGTDVSTSFAMRQILFANRSDNLATKQAVYANRSTEELTKQAVYADRSISYAVKQVIYVDRSVDFATRQAIYAERSTLFATLQQIYSDYFQFSANYPLLQVVHADRSESFATKQSVHTERTYLYATMQRFYDSSMTIIGTVHLDGDRTLYVYLIGDRQLKVNLEGGLH